MAKQVFIIKDYHVVVLILESTTEVLQPNNLNPPYPPFAQVIVNLLGGHIDPSKLRDHECNLPNMHLLEPFVGFDPCPTESWNLLSINPDWIGVQCIGPLG